MDPFLHNMGTSYLPNSDLLTGYIWKLIGMNPELLHTLIKESLTNISPRLLGEGEDQCQFAYPQCWFSHPCLTSRVQGGASSRGLYFHRFIAGSRRIKACFPESLWRGFSWGADNGNFGSWGTLARIWETHASVDDDQPPCPKRTTPFYIHGDEGRGQCKRPLLVLSFQPVLGWQKDATINKEDAMNSKKPLNPDQKYRLCDAWLQKKYLIGCGLCYSVSWLDATTHPGQLRRIETQLETSASFILNPASRKPIFFQSPCLVAWYRRSTHICD